MPKKSKPTEPETTIPVVAEKPTPTAEQLKASVAEVSAALSAPGGLFGPPAKPVEAAAPIAPPPAKPSAPAEPVAPVPKAAPEPPTPGSTPPPEPPSPSLTEPPETPKPAPSASAPPPVPEPAPEPPPEPVIEPEPAPARMGEDEIDELAARIARQSKATAPPAPAETAPQTDPKLQRKLDVLAHLETMDPQYRGLANKTRKYWTDQETWVRNWMAAHPGEEPGDDNPEYRAWADANEPTVDPDDFDAAQADLIERRVEARLDAKRVDAETKLARQRSAEKAAAQIDQAALGGVVQMITAVAGEAYKDKANDLAELDKAMSQQEPAVRQVLIEDGEELNLLLKAVQLATRFPESTEFGAMTNLVQLRNSGRYLAPAHQAIVEIVQLEKEMAARPVAETTRQGKKFVTKDQWSESMARINNDANLLDDQKAAARKQYRDRHWELSPDDMALAVTWNHTQKTARRVAQLRKLIGNGGKPAGVTAAEVTPKPAALTPAPAPVASARTRSPALVSESDAAVPAVSRETEDKIVQEMRRKVMFGG